MLTGTLVHNKQTGKVAFSHARYWREGGRRENATLQSLPFPSLQRQSYHSIKMFAYKEGFVKNKTIKLENEKEVKAVV